MNLQAMHDLTKTRMQSRKIIESDVRPRSKRKFATALHARRQPIVVEREVDSEAISEMNYDENSGELFIRYRGGGAYTYYAVPLEEYLALRNSNSKGKSREQGHQAQIRVPAGEGTSVTPEMPLRLGKFYRNGRDCGYGCR